MGFNFKIIHGIGDSKRRGKFKIEHGRQYDIPWEHNPKPEYIHVRGKEFGFGTCYDCGDRRNTVKSQRGRLYRIPKSLPGGIPVKSLSFSEDPKDAQYCDPRGYIKFN